MACGDDDAAAGFFHGDCYFCGGCGGKSDVDDVETHAHECAADDVLYHWARDACVSADYNLVALGCCGAADECGICRCELHDVERIERIAGSAAYGASDARDGFDECHVCYVFLCYLFPLSSLAR